MREYRAKVSATDVGLKEAQKKVGCDNVYYMSKMQ